MFTLMKRKYNLNSDGHQFHQYQQNKQSPFILTDHSEHKKTTTCDVGNPCPAFGQAYKCGGDKPVNGNPNPPLLITGSPREIIIMSITVQVNLTYK